MKHQNDQNNCTCHSCHCMCIDCVDGIPQISPIPTYTSTTYKYQRCPVCDGRQTMPDAFYIGGDGRAVNTAMVKCRTCSGKGIVM